MDPVNVRNNTEDVIEDKSPWIRWKCLRFNPVVSFTSMIVIAVFVAVCCVYPDTANAYFLTAKSYISGTFTWLYIGSQDIWALMIIWLYFSKYSNLKLGKDDDEPEFNLATWFVMLFACGIGVGLFFYGVAEPMYHYTGKNRYNADPTVPDNTLAQIAINITLYQWGIHGWIVYCIVGLQLSIIAYRKNLPMTIKSCFYPLLGDKIFSWVGDSLDILSILTTLFGVCTSLGLGVMQLNTGINYINSSIAISTTNQIIITWCITAIATMSTLSGIGMGIRRLSEVCFAVGMLILLICFFLDESWFILNLITQSIGYYFQWIIQIGWHCDAFELLNPSDGREDRFRSELIYSETVTGDGPMNWMDGWTMFYWGWWISWSPFVGMFIARISKGRTIKEFINGTLTAPILYVFIWLITFGGAGFNVERQAASLQLCCNNFNVSAMSPSTEYLNTSFEISNICNGGACNDCSRQAYRIASESYGVNEEIYANLTDHGGNAFTYNENSNRFVQRLSCLPISEMWFSLMMSYGDLGGFLCITSLIGLILYFVTSSDSGSYVIDCLSANGDPDPPRVQRAFWALLEGATATALLAAGGPNSLNALKTMSIVAGLPYTIIICFMCIAMVRLLRAEFNEINFITDPKFKYDLVEPITTLNYKIILITVLNIFKAPYTFAKCLVEIDNSTTRMRDIVFYTCTLYLFLIAFVVFHICDTFVDGLWSIAWVSFVAFATCGGAIRTKFRNAKGIYGNPLEDFFAALLVYPLVATQLHYKEFIEREILPIEKPIPMSTHNPEQFNNKGYISDGEVRVTESL